MTANNRYNKKSINSKGRRGKPCQARASLNPYPKLFGVLISSFIFLILLSSTAYAFAGYNFFVYNPASIEREALAEIPAPLIKSVSAYPDKVMPGQILLVTAEVESIYPVKSAVAFFENENEPVEMKMLLISGTSRKGIYEARWIAQNTKAQKWYNTTILFTNIFNKKSEAIVAWQDPTVTHKADEIESGTFPGNYNITGNLNITSNLNVTGSASIGSINSIKFPATQVASSNANALDDYEEGEWTGAFLSEGGTITISNSYKTGTYVKIGRMVTVTGLFLADSVSSPTGYLIITGLPFPCGTGAKYDSGVAVRPNALEATAATQIVGYINTGESQIRLSKFAAGVVSDMAADVKANSWFVISATYFID